MSRQNYQSMKKVNQTLELEACFTENCNDSPEEELKFISSSSSFEPPSKIMAQSLHTRAPFLKRESFTLNGWENSRNRAANPAKTHRDSKSHQNTKGKSSFGSPFGKLRSMEQKRAFHTLHLNKNMMDNNFKYGKLAPKPKEQKSKACREASESEQFKEQLNRQKVNLLHFYQNEKVKRRLMNDLLDLHQSVQMVQYPLSEMGSSLRGKRKMPTLRRY